MENLADVMSFGSGGESDLADVAISAKTLETRKEVLRLEKRIGNKLDRR